MNSAETPINREQLQFIAGANEQQELDGVWYHFYHPGGYGHMSHNLNTFEERREGFLWTLKRLIENGHIVLLRWSDKSLVTGNPDEQVDILRQAFPGNDEGLEDGVWFFSDASQVGVLWEWPGRDPKPFVD